MTTENSQNPQSETPQYPQWQQPHREAQLKHQIEIDLKEKQREAQQQAEAAAEAKRREDGFKTAMSLLKLPAPQSGTSLEIDGFVFSLGFFREEVDRKFRPTLGAVPPETAPRFLSFEIMISTSLPEDITEQEVHDYATEYHYYDPARDWPRGTVGVERLEAGREINVEGLYKVADKLDYVKEESVLRAKEIRAWKKNLVALHERWLADEQHKKEESEKQAAIPQPEQFEPPSFSDQLVDLIRQLVRKEVDDLRMGFDSDF